MVTVPGCVDGLHQVLKKYGDHGIRDLLRPAIEYADLGHPTSHQLSTWVGMSAELNRQSNHLSLFLRNGRPLKAGELLVQSDLAEPFVQLLKKVGMPSIKVKSLKDCKILPRKWGCFKGARL